MVQPRTSRADNRVPQIRPLVALLLITACSQQPAGQQPVGGCQVQHGQIQPGQIAPVADLPATVDPNGLVVTGQVERSPVKLVLDTASERTVLTPATADYLLLARVGPTAGGPSLQPGDSAPAFADITLGHADFQRRFRVAPVTALGGVIGGELLSDDALDIDIPNQRVRLWRTNSCGESGMPWLGGAKALPAVVTDGDLVRVPVTIDGRTIQAVLDTAAPISLLETAVANALGVSAIALAADPKAAARGPDDKALQVPVHRFSTITVGPEQVAAPRIGVADFQLDQAQMLLGLDFLRNHRVWVSYPTGEVFVQAVPAGVADAPRKGPS